MARNSVPNTTKAKQTPNAKELARQVDNAVIEIGQPLFALRDIGKNLKGCPFIGWTMRECIRSLTERVRLSGAKIPVPTDPKAAAQVRALLREGKAALDAIDGGAELLDADHDCGMKRWEGAPALGAAVEILATKAGVAIESAAALMGADFLSFGFYDPSQERAAA